jgi:hypothetical protein
LLPQLPHVSHGDSSTWAITVLAGVGEGTGVGPGVGVGVGLGAVFVAVVGGAAVVLEGDVVFPPQDTKANINATMIVKD